MQKKAGSSYYSVVIIEDDADTRMYLNNTVKSHPRLELMGSASNCAEALPLLIQKPNIALIDLELPDGSGIDLVHRFFAPDDASTAFVVMTVFGDNQHVIPALEAGASGYLLKDMPEDEIGSMISLLLDGGAPVSPIIAHKLLKRFHPRPEENVENPLTQREQDVLLLLSKGFNYNETALHLNISCNTVTGYVKNIYRKLSVHSKSEAVYEASAMGLLNF